MYPASIKVYNAGISLASPALIRIHSGGDWGPRATVTTGRLRGGATVTITVVHMTTKSGYRTWFRMELNSRGLALADNQRFPLIITGTLLYFISVHAFMDRDEDAGVTRPPASSINIRSRGKPRGARLA